MASLIELAERGELTFTWRAVGDKSMCPDCADRHGLNGFTLDEWQSRGLPGTGHTQCQGNCRCVMLPDNLLTVESEVLEPFEIGPALEGVPGVTDRFEAARIAINMRLLSDLPAGTRVRYQGAIPQLRGMTGTVRPGATVQGMTIDFDFAPSGFPGMQSLFVGDFTEVIRIG